MLRAAGAALLLMSALMLGVLRRKIEQKRAAVLSLYADLFRYFCCNVEFCLMDLSALVSAAADSEVFSGIVFLGPALLAAENGGLPLRKVLAAGFSDCEQADLLAADERGVIRSTLLALGTEARESEIGRLGAAEKRLRDLAAARTAELAGKRGFYETIYTLAAAALLIFLL